MKNLKAVFLVLGFLLSVDVSIARAQSAEEMVSNCKELAEAKVVGDQIAIPHDFDSGKCWGAFGTLQTAISVVPKSFPKDGPVLEVCAPEDSTHSQLIKIFMAYAMKHPEELHKDYFFVALAALREVFPCPK
jgi:hypothetical protein